MATESWYFLFRKKQALGFTYFIRWSAGGRPLFILIGLRSFRVRSFAGCVV
ncbi:MAG: hypothetical protein AVDCRST_MAG95-319 [uncultured Adhaeribacter sp.]|uniref:Uncharacterized protein n=1 Tax=uncultured Adhaeribacter sp. TaxID=448109 RepID=A0A6J4H7L8_9BACT|nr:MAG: hypothetical protein AVDCRST_MAG95-319 [uncultured Adhaeribacter sp.]